MYNQSIMFGLLVLVGLRKRRIPCFKTVICNVTLLYYCNSFYNNTVQLMRLLQIFCYLLSFIHSLLKYFRFYSPTMYVNSKKSSSFYSPCPKCMYASKKLRIILGDLVLFKSRFGPACIQKWGSLQCVKTGKLSRHVTRLKF